ncbi:MAG TPA: hypothetical protein VF744_05910 [Beijerinckiaceae bacterium]|jgi:hypothetical protein
MARAPKTPADIAQRLAGRRGRELAEDPRQSGAFRRETFRLPREKARETAKAWFERYPKAAYLTKVESWHVTDDGLIEFTMRRLPTAD